MGKGGRKRWRETSMCGCLSHTPFRWPGLQPRHVPWRGIELVTIWFTGRCQSTESQQPGHKCYFFLKPLKHTCLVWGRYIIPIVQVNRTHKKLQISGIQAVRDPYLLMFSHCAGQNNFSTFAVHIINRFLLFSFFAFSCIKNMLLKSIFITV